MSDYLSPESVAFHLRCMAEDEAYEAAAVAEYEARVADWEQQRADMMDEALS